MAPDKEAKARIKINKLLEDAGWRFFDNENANAEIEIRFSATDNENNLILSVFTGNGQLLKEIPIAFQRNIKLNVSDFSSGTNFCRIHNNHFSTSVQKFIIK